MKKEKIKCENCNSKNIIKKGLKKNKLQTLQRYFCKNCNKTFTSNPIKQKTYPIRIILKAASLYNLGYTQEAAAEKINNEHRTNIKAATISIWLNEYKDRCAYYKLREKAIRLYKPSNAIFKKTLHHIQPYTFKYHKAKLHLLFHDRRYNNEFTNSSIFYGPLKKYLEKIPTKQFPHHIFKGNKDESTINNNAKNNKNNEQRVSQIKFKHLKIDHIKKQNQANKLAKLALNLAKSNKDRHSSIQNFMLINDSTTIAVEIPTYLTNWDAGYYHNQKGFTFPLNNYKTPITGHIDILQIRNGLIHILDYKPDADKQQPIEQLTLYALALSRKLNLPLYWFKCAWFDDKNYYEFFPLHVVYKLKKRKGISKSQTRLQFL